MSVSYVYHDRLVGLARQAGATMNNLRGRLISDMKDGQPSQVVTEADRVISRLLRKQLGANVLEEESIDDRTVEEVQEMLVLDELFIGDPVDGTAAYARAMGTEGVTIGVYRHGVPVAGVIYCPTIASPYAYLADLPSQGILVYAELVDDDYVGYYRISGSGRDVPLSKAPADLGLGGSGAFFGLACGLRGDYLPHVPLWPWHTHSVVGDVIDVALGKTCGMFFTAKLWDKAGAMAIWRACGLEMVNIETGEVVKGLRAENYQCDPPHQWRIAAPHLVCHPDNLWTVVANLRDRQGRALRIPAYD